ncbi:GNAT family N-acetyltransferase [bacterium]|nr:GNAT family N-acetyltransferase [bacterium]
MKNNDNFTCLKSSEFFSKLNYHVPGMTKPENKQDSSVIDVYFERVSMDGLEEMHQYSTNPRLYEFLEFEPFVKLEDTHKYIQKLLDRIGKKESERTSMYWFVRRKSDKILIGTIGLLNIDYNRQSTEWGFGIDPNFWSSGYIFEILDLVIDYVFEELKLNRLFSTTSVNNLRTIEVLKNLGFKFEGELRDYYRFKNDGFKNAGIYSILARDYSKKIKKPKSKLLAKQIEVEKTVISLICKVLETKKIDINTEMHNFSKWDSLAQVNLMLEIAEEFNIDISPEILSKATSVKKICNVLSKNEKS